jgi:hypothetical protein
MDAEAVAPKLNVTAAVTPMNMTDCRINALLENTEAWVLTTTPWLKLIFPAKGSGNEKYNVDVQQFSLSKQPVSKSEGQ